MPVKMFFTILILIITHSCKDINRKVINQSLCLEFKREALEIEKKLIQGNDFGKLMSDSFMLSIYAKNYKKKLKLNGNQNADSISILVLDIYPYTLSTPYGDSSSIVGVTYFITDSTCTNFYDSVLALQTDFINGIRFSTANKKIVCYLNKSGRLLQSDSYMNYSDVLKSNDFISELRKNINHINPSLRKYLPGTSHNPPTINHPDIRKE